jgi:hypothetical protein
MTDGWVSQWPRRNAAAALVIFICRETRCVRVGPLHVGVPTEISPIRAFGGIRDGRQPPAVGKRFQRRGRAVCPPLGRFSRTRPAKVARPALCGRKPDGPPCCCGQVPPEETHRSVRPVAPGLSRDPRSGITGRMRGVHVPRNVWPSNSIAPYEFHGHQFLLHLLFVLLQRRQRHVSLSCVSTMGGLAGVPQCHLGEAFGIASALCSFCPRVAMGVQGNPLDADATAGALK